MPSSPDFASRLNAGIVRVAGVPLSPPESREDWLEQMATIEQMKAVAPARLSGAGVLLGAFFTAFLPVGGVLDREIPDASARVAKEVPLARLPGIDLLPEWRNATLFIYRDHTKENGEGSYVVACRDAAQGAIQAPATALRVRLATNRGHCAEAELHAPIFAQAADRSLPGDINDLLIEVASG